MTFPLTWIGMIGSKWLDCLSSLVSRKAGLLRGPPWVERHSLLAALVGVLLFQSVLVDAHVHRTEALAASVASAEDGSAPSSPQDDSPQKSCLLCDQGAFDDLGLVPDPVGFVFFAPPASIVAIIDPKRLDVASDSHLWQSRAPPQ
ncbi:hypothetical protein [Alteriqipengyuania sp. 357]